MNKQKAINIINSIEPNGELMTTEQVIECMEVAQQQINQSISTSSIIKFGAYLTGHDTETIEQMYNDWEKQQ